MSSRLVFTGRVLDGAIWRMPTGLQASCGWLQPLRPDHWWWPQYSEIL